MSSYVVVNNSQNARYVVVTDNNQQTNIILRNQTIVVRNFTSFADKGDAGEGVPVGGTTGQVLAKASGADYDTQWVDQTGGGGAVDSVNGQTGVVVLTKSDIGLGNVDNTTDLNKPISTATQTALDGKANFVHSHIISDVIGLQTALDGKAALSHSHVISDVSGLQSALDGKASSVHTHISTDITDSTSSGRALLTSASASAQRILLGLVIGTDVQAQSARLHDISVNLTATSGTIEKTGANTFGTYTVSTFGKSLIDDADASTARTTLGLGTLATQSGTFSGTSSGTNTGDQNVFTTIAVSGQSNVVADSTSDTLTLVAGTNITITTNASTDTITISSTGGGGGTTWGSITGTLSSQTDLQTALNGKENTITAGTTAQYYRGDKTFQTLNTAAVPESGNLYYTNARAIAAPITGFSASAGTVTVTDTILQAINKIVGNISSLVTGVSSVFGRSGAVTAQSGDYNTSQVTESGNLYFTDERAQDAALSIITASNGVNFSYNDAGNSAAISLTYGSTANTVCQGNDARLSDARTPLAHTHVAENITDFSEAVDDRVAALLVAGSNITLTYNDVANTLTIASTGGGGGGGTPAGSNTQVQFNNGGAFGADADFTYNSTTNTLTVAGEVVTGNIQTNTSAGGRLQTNGGADALGWGFGGSVNGTLYGGWDYDSGTANRILGLNGTKTITALDTATYPDLTELSYVKGVTSAIQTQLNNRALISGATFTGAISATNLSGTNTGDQTITLTGDVTGSGTASFAATIAANAVTNNKLADMAGNTVKGRADAASGDPSDIAIGASQLFGRGSTGNLTAITLGTNLSMSGTTLNATGGGGGGGPVTRRETFIFDGAGSVPVAGRKSQPLQFPYNATIVSWTLIALDEQDDPVSASCVVDLWKDTTANYPPTNSDSITASAKPTLTSQNRASSSTLTGWTTSITAGDWIIAEIESASTATKFVLYLETTT